MARRARRPPGEGNLNADAGEMLGTKAVAAGPRSSSPSSALAALPTTLKS